MPCTIRYAAHSDHNSRKLTTFIPAAVTIVAPRVAVVRRIAAAVAVSQLGELPLGIVNISNVTTTSIHFFAQPVKFVAGIANGGTVSIGRRFQIAVRIVTDPLWS